MISNNASTHIQQLVDRIKTSYREDAHVELDPATATNIFYKLYGVAAQHGLEAARKTANTFILGKK